MSSGVMTLPEVAEYLRLTEKTTYRLAADGTLPGFKAGGSWPFRKADIDAWIEAKKAETKKAGVKAVRPGIEILFKPVPGDR